MHLSCVLYYDAPVIPATRFFDRLFYVGDMFVGCFVVETSEGLMLLDCLFPDVEPNDQRPITDFSRMKYANILEDGGAVTLGDTTVYTYATPGHTPGCMSFILPVTDEGRPHTAALWGGTGIPREEEWQKAYLKSAARFTSICDEKQVDVEIATHPFTDNSIERLAVCRNISNGVANPYVIGRDACRRYESMFADLCRHQMERRP